MIAWMRRSNALDIIFVIKHLKMNKSSIVFTMKSTMDCLALWVLFAIVSPYSFVNTIIAGELECLFSSPFHDCWHSPFKRLMTDHKDEKSIQTDNRRDLATCGTLHHFGMDKNEEHLSVEKILFGEGHIRYHHIEDEKYFHFVLLEKNVKSLNFFCYFYPLFPWKGTFF